MDKVNGFAIKIFAAISKFNMALVQSARETFKMCVEQIIPFLICASMLLAFITKTTIGCFVGDALVYVVSNPIGILVIAMIFAFPTLSPVIGPGTVISQILGVLIGGLIGMGEVPLAMALPAIFAIHQPCGGDFVPVGISLTEAEPETTEVGVTAVLYSKFIIAPIEMILAIIIGQFVF